MSQRSSAAVVGYLTTYARGIFPDLIAAQDPIIARMAPFTPVASATGFYKNYSDKNAFQNPGTARAVGGEAKRLEFLATDAQYACTPQALDIGIDDVERDEAGAASGSVEEAKIKTLLSSAAVSHIADIVAVARTLSAAATPNWSDPAAATPVSDLDTQIQAIADDIGMFPTDIVFGLSAWRRFRGANQVRQSFPNATSVNVNADMAAGILLNPSIRVGVTTAIRDQNKPGAAKSTVNVLANDVFVFFTSPNPSAYDASFMKTFLVSGGIDSVRRYRKDGARSDMLGLDWNRDIRLTSSISARRLTVTV